MLTGPASLSAAAVALPPDAARVASPAFSYDDAVAALERQSARSLEVHGGRPRTALNAGPASENAATRAPTPEAPAPATDGVDPVARHATREAQPALEAASPAPVASPAASHSAGTGLALSRPLTAAPVPPPAAAAISAREGAARLKADAPQTPAPQRAQPGAVRQFAEILARRLDDASQFDLRLDPPALGSVEGRLTLSDDGRATLALTFDNQPAFDLFRRDETALRAALADAGFDLSGRSMQFSFRAPSGDEPQGNSVEPARLPATARPLHRGVIDIRA